MGEFVYITDDTYTKKQVLRMEHLILKVLAFDLSVPTTLSFITSFSVSSDLSETTMFLAMVRLNHLFLNTLNNFRFDFISPFQIPPPLTLCVCVCNEPCRSQILAAQN